MHEPKVERKYYKIKGVMNGCHTVFDNKTFSSREEAVPYMNMLAELLSVIEMEIIDVT